MQVWDLDLTLFRFDFGMSWAFFALNADRTLYGRYGSRSSAAPEKDVSVEGLRQMLTGALELDRAYRADPEHWSAVLAAKAPPAPRWPTPGSFPETGSYNRVTSSMSYKQMRGNCLHCHNVEEFERISVWKGGGRVPDRLIWPYPMPSAIGLELDPQAVTRVRTVEAGSPAAHAGLEPGDLLRALDGQPLLSLADVQWVLQNAADEATLPVELERSGESRQATLEFAPGWRQRGDISWRGSAWEQSALLGMFLDESATPDKLALKLTRFPPGWMKGRSPAAERAGLKPGDLIVAVDGRTTPMTVRELLVYVQREKTLGERLRLQVLRDGATRDVSLRLQ